MTPLGYVILQHGILNNRPVKAYQRWADRIPATYRTALLGTTESDSTPSQQQDANCLALLKHYRSLMPLAMEAHKPIFQLKPADGAIGAHVEAVRECSMDFRRLALKIADKAGIELPS